MNLPLNDTKSKLTSYSGITLEVKGVSIPTLEAVSQM